MSMRVYINPTFRGEDRGDGGIRRVVEAQRKWLPKYGFEVVDDVQSCDVAAFHAGTWTDPPVDVPVVAHCHGLYWDGYEWPRWALALNKDVIRTLKQADAVTAPSNWVAQALRRGLWADAKVCYHGVDPEDWPKPKKPGDYVLWNKSRVDAICDPVPVNELALLASDVSFVSTFGEKTDNVSIVGVQPYETGKQLTREAGVYLCTARETFGIGTLEAMCSGIPVLGWKWGGQAEFVGHKQHGYLAEPGDYGDLVVGLRYCLEHRADLGKAAHQYVLDNFTWEHRIADYAELYLALIEANKGRPKVSVVITNYNLGKYLLEAVESARQAVKGGCEVIVVDDASTEPLPRLPVGQASDVKLIRNKKNLYLAEALNVGVGNARGKYIVPLDADNVLVPGALGLLAEALDKDRALDIAYGKMEVVREGEEPFVSGWPPELAEVDQQLAHRNQISSTAMLRRRVWEHVGGYRRRCHTAEDADFWSRALAVGFSARRVTDTSVFSYRDRRDSMSHVQADWAWNEWYNRGPRPFGSGGPISTHEFPEITVVIPVGPGHERLVLDALDSVHNQTFGSWECVVVNDTGHELPWVHPWAVVKASRCYGNEGASTSRNVGMRFAKGRYVLFLDADDWLHPDALGLMYDAAKKKEGTFVYSDWFVAETGEVKRMDDFDPDAVLRQVPFPVTCLYKRSDLLDRDVWFDVSWDGKGWEDWDFALQVVAKAGLCGVRIPAPLFHYRTDTGTLRDKAYLARETLKGEIWNKWADYIEGRKENMARGCGCGGMGFVQRQLRPGDVPVAPTSQADGSDGEQVSLIEYTGEEGGFRTFVGRVTGTRYRFGADPEHKMRRVYARDVPALLGMGYFREANGLDVSSFVPLEAKGPPKREQEVAAAA